MLFTKETTFSIDPEYLKKATELITIKENFEKWDESCRNINNLPLADSLGLLNRFAINFPRIIMPDIYYPMRFYRARIISSDSKEDISKLKTFSCPPKEKVTHYQRANVPGYPVFYGAVDGQTALEELRFNGNEQIKKGDLVYLSEWRVKEGKKFSLNFLTLSNIVKDYNQYADITKKVYSDFSRIFKNEDLFFMNKQLYLFNKISQLFLTGRYIQSGTIAYQILYNTPEINGVHSDGILYPSCSNDFRSINCALLPEFVEQNMEISEVRKISFESFNGAGANLTVHYFGINENNKVIWKKYMSELITSNYKALMVLTSVWEEIDVQSAKLYLNDKEFDLRIYCDEYVNNIDLSNHKIEQNQESVYRTNGNLTFRKVLTFDGNLTLKKDSETNEVKMLIIEVPIFARIENVDTESVKKDKDNTKSATTLSHRYEMEQLIK